jgi:membrane-bound serine protease (ClpP class)
MRRPHAFAPGATPLVLLLLLGVAGPLGADHSPARLVLMADVDGAIDPGTGEYVKAALRDSAVRNAEALIIRLDTPGGLVSTTREIVEQILASPVPVIVWVAPEGGHAGSAGLFLTLASHVAAMAPSTAIGAAHPVNLGPAGPQRNDSDDAKTLNQKQENDLAALAESLAMLRKRNAAWSVKAVRQSEALPAERAVEEGVVELIARTPAELLSAVDGRVVVLGPERVERPLQTRDAVIEAVPWRLRHRLLHFVGDPSVASLLVSIGTMGLLLELFHPGAMVPGIVGLLCLILGVTGLSALPVHAGGVALLLLGVALWIAELFVTSYGLLGLAGTVAYVLGSVLLTDPHGPGWFADRGLGVRLGTVLPVSVMAAVLLLYVGLKAGRAARLRPRVGAEGLVGEEGTAEEALSPHLPGFVCVHGERWRAMSRTPVSAGARVVVRRVEGLRVEVDAVPGERA